MNKKHIFQPVKNLCKLVAIVYGSGVLLAVIYYLLDYIGSVMNFGDAFWTLLSAYNMFSFVVFGLLSFWLLVPGIAILSLIIGGIVYAIREKNVKNIFNFPLWATVVLVGLNTVLQLDIMSQMF